MNLSDYLLEKYPVKEKKARPRNRKAPPFKPKLTIEQIAECFELVNKGVYYENLALIYGVSKHTLKRYMRAAELYGYSFWENSDVRGRDGAEEHGTE